MTKETAHPAQICALIDNPEDAGNRLAMFWVLQNNNASFKIMTSITFFEMSLQANGPEVFGHSRSRS